MKRLSLLCALGMVSFALSAQSAPVWQPQLGVVWSQPQGDLKDVSTDAGWGVMLATQAQDPRGGSLRLFGEYRRFKALDTNYSLTDAGLLFTAPFGGPVYGFLGVSGEKIQLPNRKGAIKLGARGGLGWNLGTHARLEAGYTTASLDHRSVNTTEASLIFSF